MNGPTTARSSPSTVPARVDSAAGESTVMTGRLVPTGAAHPHAQHSHQRRYGEAAAADTDDRAEPGTARHRPHRHSALGSRPETQRAHGGRSRGHSEGRRQCGRRYRGGERAAQHRRAHTGCREQQPGTPAHMPVAGVRDRRGDRGERDDDQARGRRPDRAEAEQAGRCRDGRHAAAASERARAGSPAAPGPRPREPRRGGGAGCGSECGANPRRIRPFVRRPGTRRGPRRRPASTPPDRRTPPGGWTPASRPRAPGRSARRRPRRSRRPGDRHPPAPTLAARRRVGRATRRAG